MYKLEFFIRTIGDNQYAFDYKFYQNNNLLDAGTYKYAPWTTHDSLNSVRGTGRWALRTHLSKKYGVKSMQTFCTNPDSDFLSRAERRALTVRKRSAKLFEDTELPVATIKTMPVITGAPQEIKRTPVKGERLYEVVEVGGVWTIKKHDTKWFTAEEAKTQLFAKVVNGD